MDPDSQTQKTRQVDPNFNWQDAAARLRRQEELAAKSAEEEQKRALAEAAALKKIQEKEHLKELSPFEEPEQEPIEESSGFSSSIPSIPSEAPTFEEVDLSGFTIPIPIKDIKSTTLAGAVSETEERSDQESDNLSQSEGSKDDADSASDSDFESEEKMESPVPSNDIEHEANNDNDADEIDLDENARASRKDSKHRKKKSKLARKLTFGIIGIILIAILAGAGFGYYYVKSSLAPLDAKSTKYVTVEIPKGSGNKEIGQILEDKNIIKDATVFNYYTKFKNYNNLQNGYYNFKASMSVDDIIKQLQTGGTTEPTDPNTGKVVIPEGYTIEQIAKAIESNANTKSKSDKTPYSSKAFLKLMKDKNFIERMKEKYPRLLADIPDAQTASYQLEGYLFPATYDYSKDTKLEDIVDQMLGTMDGYMSSYYDSISQSNYNVNEILALASLVEKEGKTDEDRRNIASVFYNRLDSDMELQSNIAVLYALGKLGDETSLKEDANIDTSIDSPYNDYKNKGIIPGPVDSPSLSAIEAVVNPSDTNYLYFVADVDTGNVYYSENYEDHQKNVDTYVNKKVSDSSE
ncbi:endolytic transglycosylase MltG [Streptococcus dentapri]